MATYLLVFFIFHSKLEQFVKSTIEKTCSVASFVMGLSEDEVSVKSDGFPTIFAISIV
jgi:uncharacterized protein (DUF169 family)